jgi:glycosyltransferase involved in cell wall biosynthesis
MGIGIFLIPYFAFRNKTKYIFWVKYANNWGDSKPKMGFRMQRWMLKKNVANCKVTINGFWRNQPEHCVSFENPCLYNNEIENAQFGVNLKQFKQPYTFLFVGRMEDEKGVQIILDLLKIMPPRLWKRMHFVGDGKRMVSYVNQSAQFDNKITFHGFIDRKDVHVLYKESHFFFFPSYASEGFPKVIAESCAFGCIPITSNVASIGHYIMDGENGYFWNGDIVRLLNEFTIYDSQLAAMRNLSEKFTYENYLYNINRNIFK